MQCPTCSGHPKLKKAPLPSSAEPITCTCCGWKLIPEKEYWICSSCSTTALCHLCKMCPQGHTLGRVKILNKINNPYHGNNYLCDLCKKSLSPGPEGVWHCIPCQFDICEECLPKSE